MYRERERYVDIYIYICVYVSREQGVALDGRATAHDFYGNIKCLFVYRKCNIKYESDKCMLDIEK